jgi:hypothetical protein
MAATSAEERVTRFLHPTVARRWVRTDIARVTENTTEVIFTLKRTAATGNMVAASARWRASRTGV